MFSIITSNFVKIGNLQYNPFAIQDISEWDSRYEPKKQPDGLNKVCGEPPCLSSNRK